MLDTEFFKAKFAEMGLSVWFVFLLAVVSARFINWAIYTWAWNPRTLGPWSSPPSPTKSGKRARDKKQKGNKGGEYRPRNWADHIPVLGWWRLRHEVIAHGTGYWIRPLLLELLWPVLMTWYYGFMVSGGALPAAFRTPASLDSLWGNLHWQFTAHFVLSVLMTIATFVDFDEYSIPDMVTVPGTIVGLLGAALAPFWLPFHAGAGGLFELDAGLPGPWPKWLDGSWGLGLGLLILGVWGFALLDRRWISRRGFAKAVQYFFARMFRVPLLWRTVFGVTLALMGFVVFAYLNINVQGGRWQYLMSSLIGLAVAGGVTWGVRISASVGLGVEALGFGDVTLMAMIGTYIGWQPSLLVFFIAPMVALVFVVVRWIVTGNTVTPYGPYLCIATVILLVGWDSLWTQWAAKFFVLGDVLLGIVLAMVALMGVMLWIWRLTKEGLGLAGR